MPKGTTFDNDLLKLIFNGTAIANLADNAASSPYTNLYLSLHTADPTSAGNQTSSETSYTNYARVAVTRNTGGWTVSTNQVSNAAVILAIMTSNHKTKRANRCSNPQTCEQDIECPHWIGSGRKRW